MATVSRTFDPSDRYRYDFRVCTYENGWAQLDTSQDASYYGQWINPVERKILCYCEGDVYLTQCESDAELVQKVAENKQWNIDHGHRFMGIDPGFGEEMKQALINAGLGEYLH